MSSDLMMNRMGWTGDLTVFAPTASFLFDTRGFFASWLQGLAVEQLKDRHGVPPVESPDTWGLGMVSHGIGRLLTVRVYFPRAFG